ncbi:hypothetical protein [Paenibacillus sp. GCM10027629]|uniref:hypothetical protein n=1 Tax=Paenibacillus sp. GCM10027629 TaxID=3273414 RepID=UPI0036D3CEAF
MVNRRNEQFFIPVMRWHLQERAHTVWTQEELGLYPEGLPIIAPPLFRNPEL